MEELKGLILGAKEICRRMEIVAQEASLNEVSREYASKEIDLLARELVCISGTIKQVAYELRRPVHANG